RLDRRRPRRGRAQGHHRRRAEGGDRRHRRHLYAQDGQSRGAVRRGPRLSQRPPCHRQHPDLDSARQPRAGPAAGNGGDGADPVVAQLFQARAVAADEGRQRRAAVGQRARGDDVDIEKIPTPVWHEHDGGPYIGTGCLVAMKDPDSGWINYGCYRVQSHAPNVASVMMSPGKHGLIIMRKYHERGEPCPVAVVVGMHPVLVMLGGVEVPYGKNELEGAGGILGEPVEVINMPKTGLPVPANAEIAFEGLIHPDDRIEEGPLGEWTGYYASGSDLEPAIRIDTLMHRDDPILVGAIPAVPPNDNTFYFGSYRCGAVWNQLEAAGIPGVQGVWTHEAGGSRFMLVISIKTLYGGHSKQAAMVAAHCHAGAYNNRWTIVVDDDIDPTNF